MAMIAVVCPLPAVPTLLHNDSERELGPRPIAVSDFALACVDAVHIEFLF